MELTKDFKPVFLICTHERAEITSQNIERLLKQPFNPQIVLVVTTPIEAQYYREKFPANVFVVKYPNNPLGGKWQFGVSQARLLMPNPLIITGSDDFLSSNFVSECFKLMMQGYHFGGLSWFYMYESQYKRLSTMRYKKQDWPIGGGRYYSLELLKKLDFELFDVYGKKNLDNKGFWSVRSSYMKYKVFWNPQETPFHVIAIKGNWHVMNEAYRFFHSPYIDVLETEIEGEEKYKQLCAEFQER